MPKENFPFFNVTFKRTKVFELNGNEIGVQSAGNLELPEVPSFEHEVVQNTALCAMSAARNSTFGMCT